MSFIGIAINIWKDIGGTGGGAAWVLAPGGVLATLDIDFVNNRAWNSPNYVSIPSLLSCTRATPALATYTNASGGIQYFAPNTLRYGTNGLLVEEVRTNICLQSNDYTVTWSLNNLTNVTTKIQGPDGVSNSASLINENTNNSDHAINQTVAKAASAIQYVVSCIMKQGPGRTRGYIALFTAATGNGRIAVFDLAGGQAGPLSDRGGGGYTATSSTITPLGDGYYLCTMTATTDTGVTVCPLVGADNGSGTNALSNVYVGVVGNGIYLFSVQLEAGAFPTSYIPTTTTSVTRAQDVVSMATSGINGFANKPGSMATQGLTFDTGALHYLWGLSDGSTPNNTIYSNGTENRALFVTTGGVNVADLSPNSPSPANTLQKNGVAWNDNDFAAVFNGGTPSTDVSGTSPGSLSQLDVGACIGDSATARLNGYVRRLTYWNSRIPNASLQLVSTP